MEKKYNNLKYKKILVLQNSGEHLMIRMGHGQPRLRIDGLQFLRRISRRTRVELTGWPSSLSQAVIRRPP